MSTTLLVGIDLVVTVLLLLAVLYALWGGGLSLGKTRSAHPAACAPRPHAEGPQGPADVTVRSTVPDEVPQDRTLDAAQVLCRLKGPLPPVEVPGEGSRESGRLLGEAVELHRQGLSAEEIARRLSASTGEVQMVLALHGMESGNAGPGGAAARIVA